MKTLDAPHGQPALRLTGGAHGPAAHQPESRPTRGLDLQRGAARVRCGRGHGVAHARGDSERRRRSEAKPERGKGCAYGVEATAARLTSGGAGRERR